MNRIIGTCLIILLFACSSGNQKKKNSDDSVYSHETLRTANYDRFILVRGDKLKSAEEKLNEFGQLSAPENQKIYQFAKTQIGDWTAIKIPSDLNDYFLYHVLVYWFLGFPPEDNNYADKVIGISLDKSDKSDYIVYNDYSLEKELKLHDELFGIFKNNEKFILNIPQDSFIVSKNDKILDFRDIFDKNKLELNSLRNGDLKFNEFDVVFNE